MATLQAARARLLGLPLASAKSWGLNRAIYYAAAKRGFKKPPGTVPSRPEGSRAAVREFLLGDDRAFRVTSGGKTLFTIGGEVQKPEDFDRQIVQRFSGAYGRAWDEAVQIVKAYPREVLESQTGFYEQVYRPRRDELAKRWTELAAERSSKT
jgi:hypothetical protein